MKRFVAQLNGGDFINVPADRMELRENSVLAWDGTQLVAFVDISVILCARITEKTTDHT